ncbi:MAG TPA: NAD(P)-binding domain-containing protein [Gemmatimonadaceae bacterium]|nr:NAD(P)-binding domain-containing protein [Gemmatimonadaceae bacterium]
MTHIAFLGTGLLGSALAEASAKRGDQVTVWNRTIDKARPLEQFGIRIALTPADAVRGAERVHLVLKDDAVVEEVVAAARAGLAAESIVVDHTTTLPARTAARATRLIAEGVNYLHCPVFIGPAAARAGSGTILVSGPRALYDRVRDGLARMAQRVEYFGERPDLAAAYKLCGNVLIVGVSAVAADFFAVAAGAELTPADAIRLRDIVNPPILSARAENMVAGRFASSFALTMVRKDVGLMLETAGSRPLATLPAIASRVDALISRGHGANDLAVIGVDSVS